MSLELSNTSQKEVDCAFSILDQILAPSNAQLYLPFLDKVDPVKLQLHDYDKYVKEPMWLRKMQSKFHENEYDSIKEFVCDFRLMLLNCYRYNGVTSRLGRLAEKLEQLFEQKLTLLPSEIKAKTSIQATLCALTPEEEFSEPNNLAKRRNMPRIFTQNNTGRGVPMKTIMEEFERSQTDGLFSYILADGDEDSSIASAMNEDQGVALLVSRLASWERKRSDQKLINTWNQFWTSHAQSRVERMNHMTDFFELYQLVFAFDDIIGFSDVLSAATLYRELNSLYSANTPISSISSLFYQHRRLLSITELEYAFAVDVKKSLLISIIFNSLLLFTGNSKEMSEYNSSLETYRTFKNAVLSGSIGSTSEFKGNKIVDTLKVLVPPSYDEWHGKVKERIESWYTTLSYAMASNKSEHWTWRKIGVLKEFFDTFGDNKNPFETKKFHEYSLYQQILFTKTLFENIIKTNSKARLSLDRVIDWTEFREKILGDDPTDSSTFFHIPGIFSYSALNYIRIYKMPTFSHENWDPDEFIASLNLASSTQSQTNQHKESLLFNSKDDSIDNSWYFVPGPIFHLPKWIPDYLAAYSQKRWLGLLNKQVLLQQAANAEKHDKKITGQGPNQVAYKKLISSSCKWLPMQSMEALYAAEGKNRSGKYTGGQRTKTGHQKRLSQHEKDTLALFESEPVMEQSDYYHLNSQPNAPYPPGLHNKVKNLCAGRLDLVFNDDGDNSSNESDGDSQSVNDEALMKDEDEDPEDDKALRETFKNDDDEGTQNSEDTFGKYFTNRNGFSQETGALKLKIKLSPQTKQDPAVKKEEKCSLPITGNNTETLNEEETKELKVDSDQPTAKSAEIEMQRNQSLNNSFSSNPDVRPETPSTEPCETDMNGNSEEATSEDAEPASDFKMSMASEKFSLVAHDLDSLQKLIESLQQKHDKLPDDQSASDVEDDLEEEQVSSSEESTSLKASRKRKSRRTESDNPSAKRHKKSLKAKTHEEPKAKIIRPKKNIAELISALTAILVEYQESGDSKQVLQQDTLKLTRLRFRKDFQQFSFNDAKPLAISDIIMNKHLPITSQQPLQQIISTTSPGGSVENTKGRAGRSARREQNKRQCRQKPSYKPMDDTADDLNEDSSRFSEEENPNGKSSERHATRRGDNDEDYYEEDSENSDDYYEKDDPRDSSYQPSFGRAKRVSQSHHLNSRPLAYDPSVPVQFIANRALVPIAPKPPIARPIPLFLASKQNNLATSVLGGAKFIRTSTIVGTVNGQQNLVTKMPGIMSPVVIRPQATVVPVKPRNIFRIRDTLFTEEGQPVKICEGKIVTVPIETVPKVVMDEANAMIQKYKMNPALRTVTANSKPPVSTQTPQVTQSLIVKEEAIHPTTASNESKPPPSLPTATPAQS